jgi:hypothetical protein
VANQAGRTCVAPTFQLARFTANLKIAAVAAGARGASGEMRVALAFAEVGAREPERAPRRRSHCRNAKGRSPAAAAAR